jgi:hypothetical protein
MVKLILYYKTKFEKQLLKIDRKFKYKSSKAFHVMGF